VIWLKTDAGRQEMQTRSQVKDRALRNLLLLVDGQKSDTTLLACVPGLGDAAFDVLAELGLIAPKASGSRVVVSAPMPLSAPMAAAAAPGAALVDAGAKAAAGAAVVDLDYEQFTARLTQLISSELGLRGFRHTLAVEKASTVPELLTLAETVLAAVRERRGDDVALKSRRALFGG
jgi:hypothetical protein